MTRRFGCCQITYNSVTLIGSDISDVAVEAAWDDARIRQPFSHPARQIERINYESKRMNDQAHSRAIHRIILTGGPGFGKSSVVHRLEDMGFAVVPEAPRLVMEAQQNRENGILPQNDFRGFALLVLEEMVTQYNAATADITIFDRGIPDIMAYLVHANHPVDSRIVGAEPSYPYCEKVFWFPPWKEIFTRDTVRYETFDQARAIGGVLYDTYESLGYQVIEVPKASVKIRAQFIKDHLDVQTHPAEPHGPI